MEPSCVHGALARPSVPAVLGLIAGQVLAGAFMLGAWEPAAALLSVSVAVMLLKSPKSPVFVAAFCVLFVAAGALQRSFMISQDAEGFGDARSVVGESIPLSRITGTLEGFPSRSASSWTLMLAAGSLLEGGGAQTVVSAPVALRLPAGGSDEALLGRLVPGDELSAAGTTTVLSLHGESDAWLRSKGAVALVRAKSVNLESARHGAWAEFLRLARDAGNAAQARFAEVLPKQDAALLMAMTLGRTHQLSKDQQLAFRRTGLLHIFSVSGLHVMLVGGSLLMVLRLFGLPPLIRVLLLAVLLFFFAALVGMRAAVIRAAILLLVFDSRELLRRPVEPLAALASIALIMLLQSPRALWQIDFQMTFLCVVVMILLSPWMNAMQIVLGRKFGWSWRGTFVIGTCKVLCISAAIQLALMPVLAGSFGEVSLIAPVANLLLLWVASQTIVAAFAFLVMDLVMHSIGGAGIGVLHWPLWILQTVADFLASVPGAVWEGHSPPLLIVALLYVVLIAGAWNTYRPHSWPRRSAWTFAPGIVALGIVLALIPIRFEHGDRIDVWFLDVGQGDATLIRTADGRAVLIDAGPESAGSRLPEMLRRRGVRELDFVIATHADADHIGGLSQLLQSVKVQHLYVNGGWSTTRGFDALRDTVEDQTLTVSTLRRGAVLALGEVDLEVLHPTDEFVRGDADRNDSSIVLMVKYGVHNLLLAGDAEKSAEEDMATLDLKADILKAGHHGAGTSTTESFLEAVAPRHTVISCGRDNRYGHPTPSLLQRLEAAEVETFRTDRDGTIHLSLRPYHPPSWNVSRGEVEVLF